MNSTQGTLKISVEAKRNGGGAMAVVNVQGGGHHVNLHSVARLGSAIDADGTQITATANSVQIDGEGTFDGKPATFRVQVTDNANNNGFFSLTCISGCTFTASGPMSGGGRLVVTN